MHANEDLSPVVLRFNEGDYGVRPLKESLIKSAVAELKGCSGLLSERIVSYVEYEDVVCVLGVGSLESSCDHNLFIV